MGNWVLGIAVYAPTELGEGKTDTLPLGYQIQAGPKAQEWMLEQALRDLAIAQQQILSAAEISKIGQRVAELAASMTQGIE